MIYELPTIYDSRKSFYGKAKVETIETDSTKIMTLYSYDTKVACVVLDKETGSRTYNLFGIYSQTTTRHQKEFFRQQGMTEKEVQDFIKDYRKEVYKI